ncbi:hypothetical protein [Klenkia soli]|uniref:hypothetical protein n=1 Tax=Klenkia soli TaxID=1052260 RepID=UPI000B819444|nr:hypothetical protein [Klenkia soli]
MLFLQSPGADQGWWSMPVLLGGEFDQFAKGSSASGPFGPEETPLFVVRFRETVELSGIIRSVAVTSYMLTTINLFTGARCPVGAVPDGLPVTAAGVLVHRSPDTVEFMVDTSGDHTDVAIRSMLMSVRDIFSTTGRAATLSSRSAVDDQGIEPPGWHHIGGDLLWPVLDELGLEH